MTLAMKVTPGSTVMMSETQVCFETLCTIIRLRGVSSQKTAILKDKFVRRGMSAGSRLEIRVTVVHLWQIFGFIKHLDFLYQEIGCQLVKGEIRN